MAASETFDRDQIWLNGKEEDINNSRLQNVLQASACLSVWRLAWFFLGTTV